MPIVDRARTSTQQGHFHERHICPVSLASAMRILCRMLPERWNNRESPCSLMQAPITTSTPRTRAHLEHRDPADKRIDCPRRRRKTKGRVRTRARRTFQVPWKFVTSIGYYGNSLVRSGFSACGVDRSNAPSKHLAIHPCTICDA